MGKLIYINGKADWFLCSQSPAARIYCSKNRFKNAANNPVNRVNAINTISLKIL